MRYEVTRVHETTVEEFEHFTPNVLQCVDAGCKQVHVMVVWRVEGEFARLVSTHVDMDSANIAARAYDQAEYGEVKETQHKFTGEGITTETYRKVAAAFVDTLESNLRAAAMWEIARRNRLYAAQGDVNSCATHEYCDANEPMLEAWQEVVDGYENEPANDIQSLAWGAAWEMAKAIINERYPER